MLKAAQDDGRGSPAMELHDEVNLDFAALEDFSVMMVPFLKTFHHGS